ncbi:MAG: TraY domain-containing protein [Parvibaculum sp.]|nr:TraY domain-containing protein [Parvibaculum sp.]
MFAIRLPPEINRRLADLAKATGRSNTFYALDGCHQKEPVLAPIHF